MKEMMLRLPVVEVSSSDDLWQAKFWRRNGRYIVRRDNGDVSVADVTLRPGVIGEIRADDERLQHFMEVYVGQPKLIDPDEIDEHIAELNEQIAQMKVQHDAELAHKDKECKAWLDEKEAELNERYTTLKEANEQKLAMQRKELEHEFEMKKMKLDLETPKRNAQGEWISGKTLTEIIKTLSGGRKED